MLTLLIHLRLKKKKKKVILTKPCSLGQLGVEVDHTNGMHKLKPNEMKETLILGSTSTTFLTGVYHLQLTMQNTVLGTAVVGSDFHTVGGTRMCIVASGSSGKP